MAIMKQVVELHKTRVERCEINKEIDQYKKQGFMMQRYWEDRDGSVHAVMVKTE